MAELNRPKNACPDDAADGDATTTSVMSPDDMGDTNTMRFAILPEKTVPLPAIEFVIVVLPMIVADLSNPFTTEKPVPIAGL